MAKPLMPKATAVWLVDNTTLTFEQIADFCGLHPIEVQAIADGEVAMSITGLDPIIGGQLSIENIKQCEENSDKRLCLLEHEDYTQKNKATRYTPVSRRNDRPDAIAWLLKHHPDLSDNQIKKLVGTTKQTIDSIRNKSHWNSANIKSRNPVTLGLCSEDDLEKAVALSGIKK